MVVDEDGLWLGSSLRANTLSDLFFVPLQGQVYKAKLRETGEEVAIKIQRPDMLESFSLDLYLLQWVGVLMDAFCVTFTKQSPFHQKMLDTFARSSYSVRLLRTVAM